MSVTATRSAPLVEVAAFLDNELACSQSQKLVLSSPSPRAKGCQNRLFSTSKEANRIKRGIPADLDGYQTKFARHLIGNWTTNSGQGPFAVTQWRFFADGTAQQLDFSGMMGDREARYLWREAGAFSVELLEIETREDEPATWFVLNYGFKLDDEQIVLFSLPEHDDFRFIFCPNHLHFEGDHPNEKGVVPL